MVTGVTASLGPWVAGQAWSTYPVPCGCSNGFCYTWCFVGTSAVMWNNIPVESACNPLSKVYLTWSGPLGYCSFPPGYNASASVIPQIPSNATGWDTSNGTVPAGTSFNGPSEVISIQALIIISTITVFFAAIAGCADAGAEGGNKTVGATAAFCSLIAWVFCMAAYCLWTAIPYVQKIQSFPPQVFMPVWGNSSGNYLTTIEVVDTWLGPGWATALTSSILIFFANLIHCASMKDSSDDDDAFAAEKYNSAPPQQDAIPAGAAVPVPAAVGAQPVPAASMATV